MAVSARYSAPALLVLPDVAATRLAGTTTAIQPSERMIAAGRSAFIASRDQLDDLRVFFEDDLREFLSSIYIAMATAA